MKQKTICSIENENESYILVEEYETLTEAAG
jgi:hypothetical protein